ncbi:MAG: dihydroorotase [Planctomycetes bacterium]|nr:dihydroorotase [Planctomycetota bacterium]
MTEQDVTELTLTRPDDLHVHLRDGASLATTVPATARSFARAIVMPNLVPPVTTVAQAAEYRGRILAAVPEGISFEPLMVLYLTETTDPDELRRAADSEFIHACKVYPAGATTNSDAGVSSLDAIGHLLEAMESVNLPLLVHGEATDPAIDVFDREKVFLEEQLAPTAERFPKLPIVFEHITTAEAAQFVNEARDNIAATITPQHLLMNRNDLFKGGLRPHHYCLPVLKRSTHQEALQKAATSGSKRFFLGTDSAPHARSAKESACGCAGCYSAPYALPLYAQLFDSLSALDKLEGFASHFGADFYRLARNTETTTLRRQSQTVPAQLPYLSEEGIIPFWAERELVWTELS